MFSMAIYGYSNYNLAGTGDRNRLPDKSVAGVFSILGSILFWVAFSCLRRIKPAAVVSRSSVNRFGKLTSLRTNIISRTICSTALAIA